MAKNVYFSNGTSSEQRLYEDLIIESLKIYGHDVYYLPREIVKQDKIFNEDILSKFDENYMIEMYLSNFEGFEGDGTLLSKFGVRISDEATFIISKRRWEDLISSSNNLVSSYRPNEGDVIYFPLTKQFFQIKLVEHEKPFRQLDAIQTYQLVAETMEFSDERFETGVPEIDGIARDTGYSIVFKLVDGLKSVYLLNGGTGYGRDTTVSFGTPGSGAQATVSVLTSGIISSINLTEPGISYTTAPLVSINGSGTNAKAVAVIANGNDFKVGETVYGSTNTAKAYAYIDLTYNYEVFMRDTSIVSVNPNLVSGRDGNITLVDGKISNISVVDTGSGYISAPEVIISPPSTGGVQATAQAIITNGKVTSINITNVGSGYLTSPTVTIKSSPIEPKGEVVRFDKTNRELELINIVGTFLDNDTLVGDETGAEWTVTTFSSIEKENDPSAENEWFEQEGDKIIDWNESNPFGEYGNMGVF